MWQSSTSARLKGNQNSQKWHVRVKQLFWGALLLLLMETGVQCLPFQVCYFYTWFKNSCSIALISIHFWDFFLQPRLSLFSLYYSPNLCLYITLNARFCGHFFGQTYGYLPSCRAALCSSYKAAKKIWFYESAFPLRLASFRVRTVAQPRPRSLQSRDLGLGCLFSIQTLVYSEKTTNPAAGPNSLATCCLATGSLVGMDNTFSYYYVLLSRLGTGRHGVPCVRLPQSGRDIPASSLHQVNRLVLLSLSRGCATVHTLRSEGKPCQGVSFGPLYSTAVWTQKNTWGKYAIWSKSSVLERSRKRSTWESPFDFLLF